MMASGTPPFDYQWQFDGTDIAGATNSSLSLTDVQAANAGNYRVVVSSSYGTATSSNASLTINPAAPIIVVQPVSQVMAPGGYVGFSVTARGSEPFLYQWQFDGSDIPGATNSQLVMAGVQVTNVGDYTVLASNPFGSILSTNAGLALANSAVVAWNGNAFDFTSVPPDLTNFLAIAASQTDGQCLALKNDGTLVGWGYRPLDETVAPVGSGQVVAFGVGFGFSAAVESDGTVFAWDDSDLGPISLPTDVTNVSAIAVAEGTGLALKTDGTVVGWGDNSFGQTSVPPGLSNVVAIAESVFESLALTADGRFTGWGAEGGLTNIPANFTNAVSIVAGSLHCMALGRDGTVAVWGNNTYGQMDIPPDLSNVVAIAAGGGSCLALKADGTVAAWGRDAVYDNPEAVPAGLSNVIAIAAGAYDNFAIVNSGSPVVLWQPASRTNFSGTPVVFIARAVGPSPLKYQWRFAGTNITGATDSTLALTNVLPVDAGSYSARVSNSFGSDTSSNAVLTVVVSGPNILNQPTNQVVQTGSNTTLMVTAVGSAPLGYQWMFDGTNIAGATNSSLALTNAQPFEEGIYKIMVTNAYGTAISSNALLSVLDLGGALEATNLVWTTFGNAPWFVEGMTTSDGVAAAQSGAVLNSQQSTLQATVTGPGTLSFSWRVSGDAFWSSLSFLLDNIKQAGISGETSWQPMTFFLGPGNHAVQWTYARNVFGGSGAEAGWLGQVNFAMGPAPASLTASPTNQTVPAGANAIFTAMAVGTPPLIYQWQFNGTNIAAATNQSLAISNAQAGNQGVYTMEVTNEYGSATSSNAMLVVNPGVPTILAQPVSQAMVPSGNAVLQATVQGSEPLNYQWSLNGTNIVGATDSLLILGGFQALEAGNYTVTVSNAYGGVLSSNATLTLQSTAVIAWGNNCCGQTSVPAGLTNPVAIAGGFYHSLALQSDGTVIAWGQNGSGQTRVPPGLTNVAAIAAGGYDSLALESNGMIVVWGDYGYPLSNPPTNAVAIAGGFFFSVALLNDGTVAAWDTYAPSTPPGLSNVVAIAVDENKILALRSNGTVVAWGGTYTQTNVPDGLTNVVAVAACSYDSLALLQNGTLVAWGLNLEDETNVPPGLSNVVAIAGGESFCVALRSDGSLVAWGDNSEGQTTIPLGLTNVVAIASGGHHTLALLNDGSPGITWQPQGASIQAGDAITLGVGAVGPPPLNYQWQFSGTNIPGATNALLLLTNVAPANAGNYQCAISNAFGLLSSNPASLAVSRSIPSFNIASSEPWMPGASFKLQLDNLSGHGLVIISSSSDLMTWTPIYTNPPVSGSLQFLVPTSTNLPASFYRAVEQ